jgi:hypothetical protein
MLEPIDGCVHRLPARLAQPPGKAGTVVVLRYFVTFVVMRA